MSMDKEIYSLTDRFNAHWSTGKVPEKYSKEATVRTSAFAEVQKYIDEEQIVSILGLRRTGKTTLLHQLIEDMIEKGIGPKRIFYFSFDKLLSKSEPSIIDTLMEYYTNDILQTPLNQLKEKIYVFFDEIQYVENWDIMLKRYYDFGYKIKFIICGSSSINVGKKGSESLAGRIYNIKIYPLNFAEYLFFQNRPAYSHGNILDFGSIKKDYISHIPFKERILIDFNDYILKGGFPENARQDDLIKSQEYINSVFEKIIKIDLPNEFPIKEPEVLYKILQILAGRNTSDLFEIQNIAKSLSVSAPTISNYIGYLQKAFLINVAYNFTKSTIKQLRTMKKAYASDSGISSSLANYDRKIFEYPENLGKIIETIVFNHCAQKYKTYFWRNKQKKEVDIIIETSTGILPIEVKYQNQLNEKDFENIRFFMQKNKIKQGIVVTKDIFEQKKDLILIPCWLFLLITNGKTRNDI